MPEIKLKNVSKVTIVGKPPGAIFTLKTDADGIPLGNVDTKRRNTDIAWRQILESEKVRLVQGLAPALERVAPPAPPPAPPALNPAPVPLPASSRGQKAVPLASDVSPTTPADNKD